MRTLPNHTRAGSTAFVIETSATYILNHRKEWKEIKNNNELDNITVDQTYNPESENAQSGIAVAEAVATVSNGGGGKPVKLLSTTVTQEAFDTAGENGITIVTVGDENLNFAPYNEILVLLYVPKNELNAEEGKLACYLTETEQYITSGKNELLKTQSVVLSSACNINTSNASQFIIRAVFADDTFLYGEVIKNGYGTSNGYAGVTNGWANVSSSFTKKSKKYVHISDNGIRYKFPAGTTVEVYGR